MVSVPWVMTMPSKPSLERKAEAALRAISRHSSGWILELSRLRISRTVMSYRSETGPRSRRRLSPSRMGANPSLVGPLAIVPPVVRRRIFFFGGCFKGAFLLFL